MGSILHMAFFVPSRKARKWLLVILTTGELRRFGMTTRDVSGVPFCGKQKVPLRLRVAGFLLYLDNHSFLQMDEENKLLPYMLILMGEEKALGRSVC